jgi:hypothetical protein
MNKQKQEGFALPVIIILITLISITTFSILSIAGSSMNQSIDRQRQYAIDSSLKAGVNYAQIQLDESYCSNYEGTPETNLANGNDKLTFQIDLITRSNDGLSMQVKNTVRLYSPAKSTTPKITKSINSTIYSASLNKCQTPASYGPIVWLDAQNSSSLINNSSEIKSLVTHTDYGSSSDNTRDTFEERQDNGGTTVDAWENPNLNLHSCNAISFDNDICSKQSTKYTTAGLVFKNVDIPKNAKIASAILTLKCSNQASTPGELHHLIKGFYDNNADANPALFNKNDKSILKFKLDSGLTTSASVDHSESRCNPDGSLKIDVKSVVQEIVSNNGWNPNSSNQATLGLLISRKSGNGSRTIQKSGNQLSISYSLANLDQSNDNEAVNGWIDQSNNGNNAVGSFGSNPLLKANEINGLPAINFNNNAMLVKLSKKLSGNKSMTVFVVVKPNFTTSASNGRLLSGVLAESNDDTVIGKSIIPLMRDEDHEALANQYAGPASKLLLNCTSCNDRPIAITSLLSKGQGQTVDSQIKINNQEVGAKNNISASQDNYSYSVDQFYIGGTNDKQNASTATSFFNGSYGEIIIYDKALSCQQINTINNYLRNRWKLSIEEYKDSCASSITSTI